jgi:hypothetical protein
MPRNHAANPGANHAAMRHHDTDPDEYGENQTKNTLYKFQFFSGLQRNIEKQRLTGGTSSLLSHSGSG